MLPRATSRFASYARQGPAESVEAASMSFDLNFVPVPHAKPGASTGRALSAAAREGCDAGADGADQ
jgi:hypothetical protein